MCRYSQISTYTQIHTHIHKYIPPYACTHGYPHIRLCMHTYTNIHHYMHIHTDTCTYIHAQIYEHVLRKMKQPFGCISQCLLKHPSGAPKPGPQAQTHHSPLRIKVRVDIGMRGPSHDKVAASGVNEYLQLLFLRKNRETIRLLWQDKHVEYFS